MDSSAGEQLHPNWRALATIHIPLKRFVKEGTHQQQQGIHNYANNKKFEIKNIDGHEIKEFYEELVNGKEQTSTTRIKKKTASTVSKEKCMDIKEAKPFDVRQYHRFAMENNVEKLKEFNYEGEDINVRDCYGWTAVMMAACEGSLEAVKFLLDLGVCIDIPDRSGRTAKDLARNKGHIYIEQLLERSFVGKSTSHDFEETKDDEEKIYPFYCEICKRRFSETSQKRHHTSTLHQFNANATPISNRFQKFNIPPRNRGLQLMVKQGWDKESGLGPSQSGRLYPVKTVIRKQRSGLGTEQDPAKVTHFRAFDLAAVQRHKSDYYRKRPPNRNDMRREKIREWKRDRRLRNELN